MNNKWNTPWFPTAFSVWGSAEFDAIDRVIGSRKFTMGPEVAAFEKEFAAFHGMKYGVMVNSGSSANLIAVASLFEMNSNPLERGDLALVPAIAWSTTYAPLIQYSMKLKLVDVNETWNAVPSSFLDSTSSFGLVVGCSILGNPAYLASWGEIAANIGAYFIEDNCESMGAEVGGVKCGTSGILNTFSFFYSHQISAIEGGMILTNNQELYDICRMLRAHGWTRDIKPPASFDEEYDFRLFGYNVRPLEMHAAIARVQLTKYAQHREQRAANVGLFRRMTEDFPITHQALRGSPDPFGLSFRVVSNEKRKALVSKFREAGIDCRLPTGGSFRMHKYGEKYRDQVTPMADQIHKTGLFLGNGALDLTKQITRAVEVMRDFFK